MFSTLRKRLTYANVTATLALVFAMSGGALAAQHYLISSTKQISPKVLKALKGNAGAPGQTGPQGPAGATGSAGKEGTGKEGAQGKEGPAGKEGKAGKDGEPGEPGPEGSPWTAGGTLPQGSTEKGQWSIFTRASGVGQRTTSPISFTIPLKTKPEPILIKKEEGEGQAKESPAIASGACKGTGENPGAGEGHLCIFETYEVTDAQPVEVGGNLYFTYDLEGEGVNHAGRSGTLVFFEAIEVGYVSGGGTWAVTAGP